MASSSLVLVQYGDERRSLAALGARLSTASAASGTVFLLRVDAANSGAAGRVVTLQAQSDASTRGFVRVSYNGSDCGASSTDDPSTLLRVHTTQRADRVLLEAACQPGLFIRVDAGGVVGCTSGESRATSFILSPVATPPPVPRPATTNGQQYFFPAAPLSVDGSVSREQRIAFHEQGYLVLSGVLPPLLVAAARRQMQAFVGELLSSPSPLPRNAHGEVEMHSTHPALMSLYTHPPVWRFVNGLLCGRAPVAAHNVQQAPRWPRAVPHNAALRAAAAPRGAEDSHSSHLQSGRALSLVASLPEPGLAGASALAPGTSAGGWHLDGRDELYNFSASRYSTDSCDEKGLTRFCPGLLVGFALSDTMSPLCGQGQCVSTLFSFNSLVFFRKSSFLRATHADSPRQVHRVARQPPHAGRRAGRGHPRRYGQRRPGCGGTMARRAAAPALLAQRPIRAAHGRRRRGHRTPAAGPLGRPELRGGGVCLWDKQGTR